MVSCSTKRVGELCSVVTRTKVRGPDGCGASVSLLALVVCFLDWICQILMGARQRACINADCNGTERCRVHSDFQVGIQRDSVWAQGRCYPCAVPSWSFPVLTAPIHPIWQARPGHQSGTYRLGLTIRERLDCVSSDGQSLLAMGQATAAPCQDIAHP
ncbi:hypothetical protein B0T19DRAFT_262662 [Cercophora scortea]|uniref:Uncharacterized protein n=1 Tax=Cercophora scortea TaxID=314031 RepID=A0AAE0M6I0_9PEZI|nr:hypothetical protein B0T19DRAFT_262662 [Cercophora scortea]